MKRILVLPGDGIGPEIVAEAVKVLELLRCEFALAVETEQGLIGGAACDARFTSISTSRNCAPSTSRSPKSSARSATKT